MRRPTWVTIVGILGLVFGLCGLFGAGQTMMMPKMMKMQKDFISNMPAAAGKPDQRAMAENMKKMAQEVWGDVPDWLEPASVALGFIGLAVSGIYIYAAIALLQMKKYAVRLFYVSASLSILYGLARGAVFAVAFSSFFGLAMLFGGFVGITIDIILLVVTVTGNKDAFRSNMQPDG